MALTSVQSFAAFASDTVVDPLKGIDSFTDHLLVERFVDNDADYESWTEANPDGYVVNTAHEPNPRYLKLHLADCASVTELQAGAETWTSGQYSKVCSHSLAELDAWAIRLGGALEHGCYCIQ